MTILELEQNSTILCDLGSVCMDWSGVLMPFVDLGGYGKRLTPGSPRTFFTERIHAGLIILL